MRHYVLTIWCFALCAGTAQAFPVDFGPGFTTHQVTVDSSMVSVTVGGHGPAVVLIHGYTQDSRMWKPLAQRLVSRFTVIAPDLPGIGNSSIPSSGLDLKTSAKRVRDAVQSLGYSHVYVVGHDIGLMVAYGYAAMYRKEVEKLALLDAFVPGLAGWTDVYNSPDLWHFRFLGPTPLALVAGRENIYFNYYWNSFAANGNRSLPESNRLQYIAAYSRPGRMASGWSYFASFPKSAVEFAALARTRLNIPVLTIAGEKSAGNVLGDEGKTISPDCTAIVLKNTMSAVTTFLEKQR